MLIVCTWCKKPMGEKPPYEDKSVTHTICEECLKKYFPKVAMTLGSFRPAPAKIQQILEAGKSQLSPAEFERLEALLWDLELYGLTPWINAKLGELMSKITWELDVGESPEWEEALVACDYAFLGRELRDMCYEVGASPIGHKKELCARLYKRNVPEVVAVMEPHLKEKTPERLPQTEPLCASKLAKIKDRLEELHRTSPEEFYRRKDLIKQAIKERERGVQKTMPELALEELRDVLKFTERLYG